MALGLADFAQDTATDFPVPSSPPSSHRTSSPSPTVPSLWGHGWTDPSRYLVIAALAVGAFSLLQLLLMGFGRDQGIYALVADVTLRGGMPYRDAWDFKPPGVYLVYMAARAVFGPGEWGIRLVEVAGFASLAPAMMRLTRRLFADPRPGLIGATLAMVIESELEFWHTAQPESFGGVLTIWALVLVLGAEDVTTTRAQWGRWLSAGLLFGLASLMKPHLLGGPGVVALAAAWYGWRDGKSWRQWLQPGIAVWAGTVALIGAVLGWFALAGAWHNLVHTLFVFAPGYASTTWRPRYVLDFIYSATHGWAMGFSAVMGVGLVLTVASVAKHSPNRETSRWLLVICGMTFLQLVGIAIQSKFFPYHYGATLPMGALLAAPGLWWLWTRATSWRPLVGPLAFVLLVAALFQARGATRDLRDSWWDRSWRRTEALFGSARHRAEVADELYTVADVDYGANQRVARWLREHTSPSQSVFIWGFEPYIYIKADRRCSSRFIYNVAQRSSWQRQWARDLLMSDLKRDPPAAFVVERADIFPVVTGDTLDSRASLERFPQLRDWLRQRYVLATRIQDFDIYAPRETIPGGNNPRQPLH